MSELSAHEVLVRARNLLSGGEWIQGQMCSPGGGRCALGWLDTAALQLARDEDEQHQAELRLEEAIGPLDPGDWGRVDAWNDVPGRTKEEVVTAFDRAIAATAPPPADPLGDVDPQGQGREDDSLASA